MNFDLDYTVWLVVGSGGWTESSGSDEIGVLVVTKGNHLPDMSRVPGPNANRPTNLTTIDRVIKVGTIPSNRLNCLSEKLFVQLDGAGLP